MANTSIVTYMQQEVTKQNIQDTLGKKTPQFIASVASLVNSNPKIAECDQKSVLSSCLVAASLDLPINQNLGFAYIIPYNNTIKVAQKDSKTGREITVSKKVMQAQFQMGYKGFIQLAMRSGQFKTINVTDVREGEIESNDRLTGQIKFSWIEQDRDKARTIGYVGYMELINGFSKQLYMSIEELNNHGARFSKTYKSGYGLWVDDFDSMAAKTVVKLLLAKYAPMTIEMQKATLADQAIVHGDSYEYIDNQPLDPAKRAEQIEIDRLTTHIENSKTIEELKQCEDALPDYDVSLQYIFDQKMKELAN